MKKTNENADEKSQELLGEAAIPQGMEEQAVI